MMAGLSQIAAKIRNIFSLGEFKRRGDDGRIQVLMHDGMVVEKKEAFPYGFCAKAKNGKAFVLCQGGNMDDFEIFPVLIGEGVTPPELEEGDAALFTERGGRVIVRESGKVELYGKDAGGLVKAEELAKQLDKMTARIDGIMDALKNAPTAPQDGGSSFKAVVVASLSSIVDKENFSNIESEKVFHGTGGPA
ncbi:MAG: phage baseplate assembly protein [Treponematales bacterium]